MLRITGGQVYDPANGIDGQVKDIFIDDNGRFANSVSGGRTIDASGLIVFPGGVDVHTHVAGGAINFARHENGAFFFVPQAAVARHSGADKSALVALADARGGEIRWRH